MLNILNSKTILNYLNNFAFQSTFNNMSNGKAYRRFEGNT